MSFSTTGKRSGGSLSTIELHGVDNLYTAGSSVWASAGISNPTFSIITFSIRLAEHFGQRLGGA